MKHDSDTSDEPGTENGPSFAILVVLAMIMLVPAIALLITGLLRML